LRARVQIHGNPSSGQSGGIVAENLGSSRPSSIQRAAATRRHAAW
jgi:hypothetical protein